VAERKRRCGFNSLTLMLTALTKSGGNWGGSETLQTGHGSPGPGQLFIDHTIFFFAESTEHNAPDIALVGEIQIMITWDCCDHCFARLIQRGDDCTLNRPYKIYCVRMASRDDLIWMSLS